MKQFLARILASIRSKKIRSTDSGLFDPFVPVGELKPLKGGDQGWLGSELIDDLPLNSQEHHPAFMYFQLLVVVLGIILSGRLIVLQISHGQENYLLAEGNRLKTILIPAPRGLIYDRSGSPLVKNTPSFSVIIQPSQLPKPQAERTEFIDNLATLLAIPASEISTQVETNKNREDVLLLENIDRDRALSLELKLNGLTGVYLATTPLREYGDLPSLGHLIGYIGKISADDKKKNPSLLLTSLIGKSGLEKQYDDYLQGSPGIETFEVDSRRRSIRIVGSKPAEAGQSLFLTISSDLQRVAATALKDSIDKNGATSGAAVAMNTQTGEILSMVSFPNFDNNVFSPSTNSVVRDQVLHDPLSPLINRAVAGLYPSGSTIKPVVATAALENKVITAGTKIDTSAGKISVGPWTFSDWKVHGNSDVKQALAESNNIFFFTVGGGFGNIKGLGAERLAQFMQRFGFGKVTGIDLPQESAGNVPTPDWKKKTKKEAWYIGDTYNLSIGQGDLLITPLQLTRATAAIANGGRLLQPRLLKSILHKNGTVSDSQTIVNDNQVADVNNLSIVREGMRQAVLTGSARSFSALSVEVAAKTGTAQITSSKERTHSWFTSFAPYHNSEIAVSVIVEGGGEGFAVAAPVAKNIIESYFNLPITPIIPAKPSE